MNLDAQWTEFKERLEAKYPHLESREARGASNPPFVLEGGFRLGLFNIDSVNAGDLRREDRAFALITRLVLPPEDALHLALVFEGEALDSFAARRDQIRESEGDAAKVRVFFHPTGTYLTQGRDPSAVEPSHSEVFGPPLRATAAWFADVARDADLHPVEIAYVNYLAAMLGTPRLRRLGPGGTELGGEVVDPAKTPLDAIANRIAALGAFYERPLIERYHAAQNHLTRKHFVILSGISGTGKTLLARAYAYAVLGVPDLELDSPEVFLIPVRPDWTDPSHLLGFMDAVANRYRTTLFLDAALRANANPHRPIFVCLDELNIAQPEYYLADIMSAMETGTPIVLHDREPAEVGDVPRRLEWPENLYLAATVNVDETTRPLSPKLLDRANVIGLSFVNLKGFVDRLLHQRPEFKTPSCNEAVALLETLHKILSPHSLHFGYRTIAEVLAYVAFCDATKLLGGRALDIQVDQKILTKLRGGRQHSSMLADLLKALAPYPVSAASLNRMQQDLELYESFQYWS